ncbi:hypothetical protein [Nonomuraea soli]|uniref:Uncharacterized protein n=1 Tax=Nonomuraea soli TaxID=1032476 RepID=A0A7W0CH80_9ACTN|nr:hypothetical protein [Nonomuraea soli]MBA2891177.1 hypothetical protein [Nonomuraea soli]
MGEEGGFADAGFAADDQHSGAAGEQVVDDGQFGLTSEQDGAGLHGDHTFAVA